MWTRWTSRPALFCANSVQLRSQGLLSLPSQKWSKPVQIYHDVAIVLNQPMPGTWRVPTDCIKNTTRRCSVAEAPFSNQRGGANFLAKDSITRLHQVISRVAVICSSIWHWIHTWFLPGWTAGQTLLLMLPCLQPA